MHGRIKYITIRYHFIRERIEEEDVYLLRVDTKNNITDLFIKALPRP